MPRSYRTSRTPRRLSGAQRAELLHGPRPDRGPAFASHAARERAFAKHEAELLAAGNPETRCWAWWEYRIGWHPLGAQRPVLERMGLEGIMRPRHAYVQAEVDPPAEDPRECLRGTK